MSKNTAFLIHFCTNLCVTSTTGGSVKTMQPRVEKTFNQLFLQRDVQHYDADHVRASANS